MRIKKFDQHVNEGPPAGPEKSKRPEGDYINIVHKGDEKAIEQAKSMVGDGKEPNFFFVTASNDYFYNNADGTLIAYSEDHHNAPVKIEDHIEVETFPAFKNYKDAKKKADELELNQDVGPRHVYIEDRKSGQIYEKYLKVTVKPIWSDEEFDDSKSSFHDYTND
jgi:hypothetical protein